MPTTNSAENSLNYTIVTKGDNSGVSSWIKTNTGNEKREKGLPVLNDTYTLKTESNYQSAADVNVILFNWKDGIATTGQELAQSPGIFKNVNTGADKMYTVYGHPDKFIYDYQQDYNNCGVDSCLNILSVAGVKEIVEVNKSYQEYLSTPIIKKVNKVVWDAESGTWKNQTVEEATYPKAQTETEDEFLLWAVKNSPNDSVFYDYLHQNNIPLDGDIPDIYLDEINDYVAHSKNYDRYETIEDLQATPREVGGTREEHMMNILNYWGVESDIETVKMPYLQYVSTEEKTVETKETAPDENGVFKRTIKTETLDSLGRVTIYKTVQETIKKDADGAETVIEKIEEIVVEETLNSEFYRYLGGIAEKVASGKGVIINGYANAFKGGKGGPHAISVVGVVYDPEKVFQTVKTTRTDADGNSTVLRTDSVVNPDVIGVYVVDSGGFLGGGDAEKAQFIDVETLYNFMTDTTYIEQGKLNPGITIKYNYTLNNIKAWADDMNIVGNDRKNILQGNDSQNYIWGGGSNDSLYGAAGDDYLYGEEDDDTLYGGKGNDVLEGGKGNDTYIFGYGYIPGNDDDDDTGKEFNNDFIGESNIAEKGSHDYIITGAGKDTIQFNSHLKINQSLEEVDGKPVVSMEISSGYITSPIQETSKHVIESILEDTSIEFPLNLTSIPIENMSYQNRDGNLVIDYTINYVQQDEVRSSNSNTITIKDYFKKSLFNSITTIREAAYLNNAEVAIVYNELDFVQDILSRGYIDYFSYANKNNTLKGTKFMDSIIGGNKNDVITGGNGSDIINGGASDDTIKAGNDNDTIWGSYGNDKIYGEKGDDVIRYQKELPADASEESKQKFAGGAYGGHDTIYSGSGYDVIELLDYTRDQLTFTRANKDLVITYDKTKGGSITIANYFSKKGNTSIKELKLANGADAIGLYGEYAYIEGKTKEITGTDGYDKLTGTAGDDTLLSGGLGNDTIYGGAGNDTLNGGLGSDKLYGQAGNNTYIFDSKALGEDTIYTSGNGKTTLDFTGSEIKFTTSKGSDDAINEYSFTKEKNDLIINYATEADYSDSDNASIRISNYFRSKGDFEILYKDASGNDATLNLKTQSVVYMNGDDQKKNKITGSNYNDFIVGYDYNDTFKGGKGDDLLMGGKGNDNLTGGAGKNTIQYTNGDGLDTINLTKGENLEIQLTGFELGTPDEDGNPPTIKTFDYEIVKKDLVISYIDKDGEKEQILTLKNFGSKDVTGATGSVKLYNNGVEVKDLRLGDYLDDVIYFTPKKYSYTGKWQAEEIDARALNPETPKNNRGAKVNAKGGNDTIYGSDHNDTLNGGDGDDVIYGGYGINKVDGGKGNDTYHLFDASISKTKSVPETTTIKDTGKDAAEDIAHIYTSLADIKTTKGNFSTEQGSIWFNIKQNGTYTTTFNVEDANGNKATITGVETIKVGGETADAKLYEYNYEQLVGDVVTWLTSKGYSDVSQALNANIPGNSNELLAMFTDSKYFTEIV